MKYIFSIIFIYFLLGLILFIFQRKILFNRSYKPKNPKFYDLNDVSEVSINTKDGLNLLAWHSKPKPNKPIMIYFHGNSYNIGERAYRIKKYLNHGWGVLLLAWRGYSGNLGAPSEKKLYIAAEAALKWIKEQANHKLKNVVVYGESLGASVAIEMGTKYKFRSVILEAPFISVPAIAQKKYKIYPVKYLVLDKFDNYSKIDKIISPLLIISGKKDEVVPHFHSIKLYEKARDPKDCVYIDEAMHNNLYDFDIEKEIIKFSLKKWI